MANGSELKRTVSKKNKYYISKHRNLELRHFCLQYKEWNDCLIKNTDPEHESYYRRRINVIRESCDEAGEDLSKWLFSAVTEDRSYNNLVLSMGIPCCRDIYYQMLRKFFFVLSNKCISENL